VVTVATGIAYLFTPLTAAGPDGHPLAFGINLRYLTPGLALGLALLPLEPRLSPARFRLPLPFLHSRLPPSASLTPLPPPRR